MKEEESLLKFALSKTCWNDHQGDLNEAFHMGRVRCYVHVMKEGLCFRVNTLGLYIEANRQVRTNVNAVRGSGVVHRQAQPFFGKDCEYLVASQTQDPFFSVEWDLRLETKRSKINSY